MRSREPSGASRAAIRACGPRTTGWCAKLWQFVTVRALEGYGHVIQPLPSFSVTVGGGQGICIDPESGARTGGADPRRDGYAIGY